ncbi:MAG: hypothetical protein QNJ46_01825 [Leptolyngbyaceae cyanobacterium MO_188.B28]|nr:hypothetical protein [Leptolyngbyaceae cyanobacterium MO_188.B28]
MAYSYNADTLSKRRRRRDRHASKPPYRPTNNGKPSRLDSGGGR